MKKLGSILFCFLPFLLTFGIQIIITFIGTFAYTFYNLFSQNDLANIEINQFINETLVGISNSNFLVGITAIYAIISSIIFFFWYKKKVVKKKSKAIAKAMNPTMFIALCILSLSLQYLCSYIVTFLAYLMPDWSAQYENIIKSLGLEETVSTLTLIYAIIIAPISEELIFRGVTFHYAKKAMPLWVANIFQASLFGLLHMNFIQGIYAFIIGIVLGYAMEKRNRLIVPIIFHIIFNALGVFLPDSMYYSSSNTIITILIFIISITFFVFGIILYKKGVSNQISNDTKEIY